MKPMYLKSCKFQSKRNHIKGNLKKLGYKNWWETEIDGTKSKSQARQIEKQLIKKEVENLF